MHCLTTVLMLVGLSAMVLGEVLGIVFYIDWVWILAFSGFFVLLAAGALYVMFLQGKTDGSGL